MIRNYLKIAFRNLRKYKFISFVNLFGLTIGLTCCLLILTYILHETSYDKYNSKASRVYRVTRSFNNAQGVVSLHLGAVAPPAGPLLQHEFPDIQQYTRILETPSVPVRYEDKIFNEKNVCYADEHIFDIFDIPLLRGNPKTALNDPYTALITEETAKRYFGNENPVDKTIRLNDTYNFKITGVYRELPDNSHMHPGMLLSFATLRDSAVYGEYQLNTNWGNNSFFTYILLPENYPARNLEAQFPAFLNKYMHNPGAPPSNKASKFTALYLQRLTDIHLRSHLDDELEANGDIKRVYIFGAIALFILLIACINYMNLSTARSALRGKEIGIRKVSGALRSEIIVQFLSESVMITCMAATLALILTWLALPWVNGVTDLHLSITALLSPPVIIGLLATPFIVGLLSGLYPALFMSSFQPVRVLKGLFKLSGGNISLRKALVIAQFSISIILIISTAVVFRQLHFIETTSLGLDKEQIVTLHYNEGLNSTFQSFRNSLLTNSNIRNVARSSRIPSGRLLDELGASTMNNDSLVPVSGDIKVVAADVDFIPAYGIQMAAGRNFSRGYSLDSASFVLNTAALEALGMHSPQEAIGKNLKYGDTKGKIIGITRDFHFESLHQKIIPMILVMPGENGFHSYYGHISIKVAGGNMASAINDIEKTWKRYLPNIPFEYKFLDENFEQLYRSEQQQGALFTSFSGIAIFIACLGLLGLSAFAISQRIKEIGIRKVLGASVGSIVTLLSKDFLILVGIAAIIAFPVAWFAMHQWLQDFAYRISMPWWIFLVAGIVAATVALVTISLQAARAASSNPVKSLRSE